MFKKLLFLTLSVIFSFILIGCNSISEKDEQYSIKEPFIYSDNIEWTNAENLSYQLAVPEETLKEMSTEALVKTVQEVPYDVLLIMTAAYSNNSIFETFMGKYNVLEELSEREDKAKYIEAALEEYSTATSDPKYSPYIQMLEYCK